MIGTLTPSEESQLLQTIEMFEVITQSQPNDYQSLEILKEAYSKLGRETDALGTAKRIAEAYMQLGQLSSAILEYETILQRYPEDPDVRKALDEIESKAASLTARPTGGEAEMVTASAPVGPSVKPADGRAPGLLDDGRPAFFKMFVEAKVISAGDFELCWPGVTEGTGLTKPNEPFLQVLADKNIAPLENTLRILCDKSRLGFMPMERYDVDVELARTFPRDTCLRWCVLPFDKLSKTVLVATANPFNQQAAKELAEATKHRLLFYIAPPMDLVKVLKKVFR